MQVNNFKKGQSIYDTAGYEYYYNQKLENGHLVNKIIEVQSMNYRGDDFGSYFIEGETIILYEIFETPPRQKKCDEIIALDTAIKSLQEKEQKIKKDILEKGKELANVKISLENKIKEFPNHNMILKVLNDNFPTYYFNTCGVFQREYGKIYLQVETGEIGTIYKEDHYSESYYLGHKDAYESLVIAEKEFLSRVAKDATYLSNNSKCYIMAKELFEKHGDEVPEYIMSNIDSFKIKEIKEKRRDLENNRKYALQYANTVKKLEEELGE